jgi:hypothetical protein
MLPGVRDSTDLTANPDLCGKVVEAMGAPAI